MHSAEVRFTETNSGDDSKGKTWGMEGNLFWFMAGGAFAFVAVLLFLFSVLRVSFLISLSIAAVPLLLVIVYVFGLRQSKPPGYDLDMLDYKLNGPGFGPDPYRQPKHPYV